MGSADFFSSYWWGNGELEPAVGSLRISQDSSDILRIWGGLEGSSRWARRIFFRRICGVVVITTLRSVRSMSSARPINNSMHASLSELEKRAEHVDKQILLRIGGVRKLRKAY